MACSPLLFNIYLDDLLNKACLLKYHLLVYADDLVFVLDSM